jgi:DNA-binding transcriptional MerR regulator
MEPLNQISLAFAEESTTEQKVTPVKEEQPVNVGVRIKALKQNAAPVAEPIIAEAVAPSEKNKKIKSTRGRKSIKQVEAEADLIEIPEDEVLFQKQYYSMGEVAEMFRVNHSLLRFWENEFDIIQPRKNRKGDRYFRPVDIKNLHLIYHLLRQRKYTIEGAKDFLKKSKKAEEKFATIRKLEQVKNFLLELKASL